MWLSGSSAPCYMISSNSTLKWSTEFGGIAGGLPFSPYAVEAGPVTSAFAPTRIRPTASVQHGMTRLNGKTAGTPRSIALSKTKPLVKELSSCSLTVLYPSGRWPLPFRRIRTTPALISCACNASSLQELAGSAHALGSEGVVDFSSSSSCRITQLRPSHSLRSGHFTFRPAHDVLTQLLPAGHVTATAPSRRGLKITARVRLELSHGIYSLLRCNRTWARVYLNTSSTSSPGIATHHALAVGESTPRTNVAGPFTASRQAVARPLCAEFTAAGSHRASDAAPRFSPQSAPRRSIRRIVAVSS